MTIKKCCVRKCNSSSARKEDFGVTYHKYPKDVALRDVWATATRLKCTNIELTTYVCSRHFRKSDFQIYKDSKYVLKSDAIPSIFPWLKMEVDTDINDEKKPIDDAKKDLNSRKQSEENVDAIRKFIEDQDKEIEKQKNETKEGSQDEETTNKEGDSIIPKTNEIEVPDGIVNTNQEETTAVASCMLDMILNQSEAQIEKNKDEKLLKTSNPGNTTMALSVGSKVEAKDFEEFWYPAEIIEVDYDEMEVLVHYENESKKHDEWISVSSPRLRPIGSSEGTSSKLQTVTETIEAPPVEIATIKEEVRMEEKPKKSFAVGERCLARWRDNRRFIATITKDLGDGSYEIVFDDGFQWKCSLSRLHKCKDRSVDTTLTHTSVASPIDDAGPSTVPQPMPAFHTHLFDPNRDYLGSKSERREMKRKLNIKEIFNIGQKRPKKDKEVKTESKPPKVVQKKPKVVKTVVKEPVEVIQKKVKKEIPAAVASIIGTVKEEIEEEPKIESEPPEIEREEVTVEDTPKETQEDNTPMDVVEEKDLEVTETENETVGNTETVKSDEETPTSIPEEEIKLEKFEQQDEVKHEQVIDKMKEVITKIEDDLNKVETCSPKPEIKDEPIKEEIVTDVVNGPVVKEKDKSKKLTKIKKGKKLRLLQEKKVKRQVEKVKSELEEMKKQVEEMRKQMMMKTAELEGQQEKQMEMPETFLLPGEWCCKWVNGQPVGNVSELEPELKDGKPIGLPRRSVQVDDKRLPEDWSKHMVRRSLGHSAGKWDVVLVNADNKRFHTKTDMRNYLENNANLGLQAYEHALMDFGVHLKLSRRMGWYTTTPGGASDIDVVPLPAGTLSSTSPLVKRKKTSHKSRSHHHNPLKLKIKTKKKKISGSKQQKRSHRSKYFITSDPSSVSDVPPLDDPSHPSTVDLPLEDGYVYVGSLKVQIIENLLRCPADACYKNFRNNTLLQMHIKHYHRELCAMMGRTPKVSDLAYARTVPVDVEQPRTREPELKTIKVKLPKLPKREEVKQELQVEIPTIVKEEIKQESPKLRTALSHRPVKRPRVLLPVRRIDPDLQPKVEDSEPEIPELVLPIIPIPDMDILDFEKAISTHTVTKPLEKMKTSVKGPISEDDEWFSVNSDVETRSSFPRSGTPDSKSMEHKPVSSESNEGRRHTDSNYMYTENGERIKLVHMKREEIINCHCGFREEDGLMVQCELCLCWQHALCHNIQKESEVPLKYTCSICLNPRRGRRSARFLHDQDRLYEGLLPGAAAQDALRRAHELAGNLLRVHDALHALRVKYHVAVKKDHPKLYLWAKDWENGDMNLSQDKLNSDYSDLNIMINSIGKENLPIKDELDVRIDDEHDRYNQRDSQLGPQMMLSGLLSSPSLDLPITTTELERLAKSVQEDSQRLSAPQPEAAIENSACRERLLRHIRRCQALIDARLDSIEAQVAELESQDPSFEDDETADYFPRTKQTIQMLMRDLDTMEELGAS